MQEQAIKRLFQQLRQADEEIAPPFDAAFDATGLRTEKRPVFSGILRVAVAVAAVAIVIGGGLFASKRMREQGEISQAAAVVPEDLKPEDPRKVENKEPENRVTSNRPSHRRHARPEPRRDLVATADVISGWRSPTEFLLSTPGNRLLKSVPNVGDSVLRFTKSPQFQND